MPDTIADGLRHTSPAGLPWEVNKMLLDDAPSPTATSLAAMRWAFDHLKIVTEPSGAAALAAFTGPGLPSGPVGLSFQAGP